MNDGDIVAPWPKIWGIQKVIWDSSMHMLITTLCYLFTVNSNSELNLNTCIKNPFQYLTVFWSIVHVLPKIPSFTRVHKNTNAEFLSQFHLVGFIHLSGKCKQDFKISKMCLSWFNADIYSSCLIRNLWYTCTEN